MVSAIEKSQAGRRLEKRGEGNRKEMDGTDGEGTGRGRGDGEWG